MSALRALRRRSRPADERGSAATELIFMTPVFMAVIAAFSIGAQVVTTRLELDDAARVALEAASAAPSPAAAVSWAAGTAASDARGQSLPCSLFRVNTAVGDFRPGGAVGVTVSCLLHLGGFAFGPGASNIWLSASGRATVEPYRVVGP